MATLLRALKALFPVLRLQPWLLSGMITLGVLAALSEGLSISLFIPLVQDQMGTQTAGAAGGSPSFSSGFRRSTDSCG